MKAKLVQYSRSDDISNWLKLSIVKYFLYLNIELCGNVGLIGVVIVIDKSHHFSELSFHGMPVVAESHFSFELRYYIFFGEEANFKS